MSEAQPAPDPAPAAPATDDGTSAPMELSDRLKVTNERLQALMEALLAQVAVTGYGDDDAVARARAAGFDHHVVKPFDPRDLLALLHAGARR